MRIRIEKLREWVWRGAVFLWVAAPILGFYPHLHPRIAQIGWWMLASCLVIGTSWLKQPTRNPKILSMFFLPALVVIFVHWGNFGLSSAWLMRTAVIFCAAIFIAQRGERYLLINSLLIVALLQIPVIALQVAKVKTLWITAGGGIAGTCYRRSGLSILAGYCSILTGGFVSGGMLVLSALSGSISGFIVPAVKWLKEMLGIRLRDLAIIVAVLVMAGSVFMSSRFDSRMDAAHNLVFLKRGWLTGGGFLPLPGMFREDNGTSAAWADSNLSEYHSTFLDWIARFGFIGVLAIAPLAWLMVKRVMASKHGLTRWLFALILLAMVVQSMEGITVLSVVGLISWILLETEDSKEEVKHFNTLQAVG